MTDLIIHRTDYGVIKFIDPLEDGEPITELIEQEFPLSLDELVHLLGELGNDVDYFRDPA